MNTEVQRLLNVEAMLVHVESRVGELEVMNEKNNRVLVALLQEVARDRAAVSRLSNAHFQGQVEVIKRIDELAREVQVEVQNLNADVDMLMDAACEDTPDE